eukprot:CAMPEP_0204338622 /NCGR_PEP_ID=MMETSP0469-20131031/21197_1 /ASSEMBLY_ACC=CAM_ASM_000384 /TAXON_ID=2969 /ORGANISM="Oxyrrhis marina" /LENGTH=284 /DNA_ID=CAMNT_0051322837 /DNA_START=42 /DNA_END=896 /DNA_ORIENTATION=-
MHQGQIHPHVVGKRVGDDISMAAKRFRSLSLEDEIAPASDPILPPVPRAPEPPMPTPDPGYAVVNAQLRALHTEAIARRGGSAGAPVEPGAEIHQFPAAEVVRCLHCPTARCVVCADWQGVVLRKDVVQYLVSVPTSDQGLPLSAIAACLHALRPAGVFLHLQARDTRLALASLSFPAVVGAAAVPRGGAPALPGQALALEAAAERLRVVVGREASEAYAREAAVVVVEGEVEEGSLWLLRRMKLGTKLIGIGTGRIPGWTVSRSTFLRMAWDGNAEVCMCRKG